MNIVKHTLPVIVVIVIYYLAKWMIAVLSITDMLGLPDYALEISSWVFAVEHHTIQLFLGLLAIGIFSRGRFKVWGLNLNNKETSFSILKKFCYYYLVYFIGFSFLIQLFNYPGAPFDHAFTRFQIIGYLGFGFILTGLSEEILFRGFMHTFLSKYIQGIWSWGRFEMPVAGFITAIIFTIAHIGFSITPFEIWHLNPLQLIQAFVLGVFYSWAYHRTGSLLAPILAHNISNGAIWTMDYLLYWIHM